MPAQTKFAIRESFLKLLEERPLSRITVRDITNDCGINRNSFYYHYPDVPSLIEEIFSDDIGRIIREHPNIESLEDCLLVGAHYAMEHKQVIRHIYLSTRRDLFETYLWRVCDQAVALYAETVFPESKIAKKDRDALLKTFSCLCYGILSAWLADGMRSDVSEYIERMNAANRGLTQELMRHYERACTFGS
ncbi:MAG: TetR/AcrR family transcriptional regulator C-terminal domain-containing protein [Oscillospiraceae bacterium]|nr:TetR/AcrR family transcriptional regulator C-terminal domain-containing protein [Oscillospiraceae bacterium]